jgi:acyl dehydratase
MNPIHHDTEFAQAAGFPGPFAVGMRQAGVLADYVNEFFGATNIRRFRVQFRAMAWPGDMLTYHGEVTAVRDEPDGRYCEVELQVTRDSGEVHLRGWATFVLPEDE